MKIWLIAGALLLALGLAACTPRIYGVPQERWEVMTEAERVAAMEAYRARQALLQERQRERARQRALEEEARRAREAEEARLAQLRIDAIYRGEGTYGDLLRITLEGGMIKFYGAHKPYRPVAFKLAAGETKQVQIVSRRGKQATLHVGYDGSNLILDERPTARRSDGIHLVFDDDWGRGATYPELTSRGPLELRGVSATVEVLGRPPRERHVRQRPRVIVVERPAPQPSRPEVIVIREPAQREREVVIVQQPPTEHTHEEAGKDRPRHHPRSDDRGRGKDLSARQDEPPGPPVGITVSFRGGKIRTRAQADALTPQDVELRTGEVRTVTLKGRRGNLKLQLAYVDGELSIDDHPGKAGDKVRLGYQPGWHSGQAYHIEETGRKRLVGVEILVQAR